MTDPAPKKPAHETHADARAATLRMIGHWAALAQRLALAAAAEADTEKQRRVCEECLAQLSMTRDMAASVLGSLPETATPRALLAEMTAMFKNAAEQERQRNAQFLGELREVLTVQSDALGMVFGEVKARAVKPPVNGSKNV